MLSTFCLEIALHTGHGGNATATVHYNAILRGCVIFEDGHQEVPA